jgi:hypothetical protein
MFWELEFTDNKKYIHRCNLEPAVFANLQNGNWQIHRNFITLNPDNEENTSVKFQFAVEKGQLRLLKKNDLGAIEFFGFFHRKNL